MSRPRWLGLGGFAGPAAFIGAWVAGGAATEGYDPTVDPISRLAAVGADTQPLMTAGLLAFGVAVPAYALVLRERLEGPAWVGALVAGVATIGVAATPLDSAVGGAPHFVAATIGSAAVGLTPALAAPALRRRGFRRAAAVSIGVSVVSLAALAVMLPAEHRGLFQRLCLTTADAWLATTGVAIATRRL